MELDRNGYSESLMGSVDGVCYLCNDEADTIRHEIYPGRANRKISKANGFWVALCVRHHGIVHLNETYAVKALKRPCMEKFLETHSMNEWMKLIGVNYGE